jgi:hypothetical protein
VYRIACNYLKTARRSRVEAQNLTFERFGRELDEGLAEPSRVGEPAVDESLLLEEVKLGCTHGMLLCLDRDHRLAYILGEILELDGPEAARVLEVDPSTFRKRLSRARADLTAFMTAKCGLANPAAACRCRRRVAMAVRMGRSTPHASSSPRTSPMCGTSLRSSRRFGSSRCCAARPLSTALIRRPACPRALPDGCARCLRARRVRHPGRRREPSPIARS